MWEITGTFMLKIYWWLPIALYVLFFMYSFFQFKVYMKELFGAPFSPESKITHFATSLVCAIMFPITWVLIGFICLVTYAMVGVHRLFKFLRK